jgi:glycosyltransferase involved in cell wall biosynthesis
VEIVRSRVSEVRLAKPVSGVRRLREQAALLRELRIDLVHVNEFGRNLDLVLAARCTRIPVVLHIHNPEKIVRSNLHALAADRILIVSRAAMKSVERFDRIADKCSLVYNSANIERISRGRSVRSSLGLSPEDTVIGSIAQLTPEKGTDIVMEAASLLLPRFPRLHVVLAGRTGEGAEEFAEQMKSRASQSDLAGHIHFLGVRTDIADLLASMDVFLLPTQAETFCLAVVEAMAAGLPVVASRVGALVELIPGPECGTLLEQRTGLEFAKEIATILERPDRSRSMGERGRQSLAGRLDPAACRAQLMRAYAAVLPDLPVGLI